MPSEESRGQVDRRTLALAVLGALALATLMLVGTGTTGDTTRPPVAEGHSYIDLDSEHLGEDRVLVKFNDKWWWVNKTSSELEYIGEDP